MSPGDSSSGNSSSEERRARLERLTDLALRELPPPRAPATLEPRVLAEIERRAALGGSAVGVGSWPAAARALLAAGCALCVPLVWLLLPQLDGRLAHALSVPDVAHLLDSVTGTGRMFVGLVQLAARVVYLIPKDWLFGGLILTSAAYAAPLALGYLLLAPRSKVHSV